MSLGAVQRNLRSMPTRLAIANAFDRARNDATMLNLLSAEHDNRTARDNPVRLDYLVDLTEVRSWTDDKVLSTKIKNLDFTIPIQGWFAGGEYQRVNVERPSFLPQIQGLPAGWGDKAALKEHGNVMSVLRNGDTATCWDGQPFWSATHLKPDGATFSNIMQLTGAGGYFADLGSPTLEEASQFLTDAETLLGENNAMQAETTSEEDVNLLVIAASRPMYSIFKSLKRKEKIGDNTNEHRDFRLVRDHKPIPGQESRVRVVNVGAGAAGAKLVLRVRDSDPEPVMINDNRVRNGFVGLGFEYMSGFKPLFFHPALSAQ